ncbi:MAG: hypothetical protein QHH15_05665 [Candidatus Thermoplasmatota archaeon]|nr:hypothetical protein [Candidatus Thermoplasmatota archaeon]
MNKEYFFRLKLLIGIIFIITALVSLNINFPSVKGDVEDEIVLNFCFQEPIITEVNISNSTYHNVTMNGTYTVGGLGLPMLPVKSLKVLLPQKGVLESINVTYEDNTSLGFSYTVMLGS